MQWCYSVHRIDNDWAELFGLPMQDGIPGPVHSYIDTIVETRQSPDDKDVYYAKTWENRWYECRPIYTYEIIGISAGKRVKLNTSKWQRDYHQFASGNVWRIDYKTGKRTLIARFTQTSFTYSSKMLRK